MNDTLVICKIGVFLEKVGDREIQSVLEFALQLSQGHVKKLISMFEEDQFAVPDGFSEKLDVNKEAPQLFLDIFYIQNIGKVGLEFYTMALANAARLDLCEY